MHHEQLRILAMILNQGFLYIDFSSIQSTFWKNLLKMAPIWKNKVGDQYEKTSNTFLQKLLLVTYFGWNKPGVQIFLVDMEQTIFWESF